MSASITQKSIDHSSRKQFEFSFFCDRCGKEWVSPEKAFSGGFCSEMKDDNAMNLLWGNEHQAAFNEANLEAHLQFNRCSQCGKWVCDNCFCIQAGNGDVCMDCRQQEVRLEVL